MICNSCGKKISEESKFCRFCGIRISDSVKHDKSKLGHEAKNYISTEKPPYPYVISISKLVILSVTTLGLYEVYWFYKHFKSFKEDRYWDVTPWARALFSGFMSYSLFNKVNEGIKDYDERRSLEAGGLAVAYFILIALWRLPNSYWLLSLLSVLPLIPVQNAINYYWEKKFEDKIVKSRFGTWNIIWAIIGSMVFLSTGWW